MSITQVLGVNAQAGKNSKDETPAHAIARMDSDKFKDILDIQALEIQKIENTDTSLRISYNQEIHRSVIKIMCPDGTIVRQIPTEDAIKLYIMMTRLLDSDYGHMDLKA